MKIIANPPYSPLSRHKKDWKGLLTRTGEWVVLATWKFCNNALEQQELILPEEFDKKQVEELTTLLGISSSYLPKNKEEKPVFYAYRAKEYSDELRDGYVSLAMCMHNRRSSYGVLKTLEITPDLFIRATANKWYKAGTKKDYVPVWPKGDYKPYESLIREDFLKWRELDRRVTVRQSIVDTVMEKEAAKNEDHH